MKRESLLGAFILVLVLAAPANAGASIVADTNYFPSVVSPGQRVTIAGQFEKGKTVTARIIPVGQTTETGSDANYAEVTKDKEEVTVTLPGDLAPGRYRVSLTYGGVTEQVSGELRVEANAVKVDAAHPTTAYRNAKGTFDFAVIGQNFNERVPRDNQIYISGRGGIIRDWSPNKESEGYCAGSAKMPCLWAESSEKLRVFGYAAGAYEGPITFSVAVGSSRSAEKKLTLSRKSAAAVLTWSVAIFAVLAFVVYRLVASGLRDTVIYGKRYSPFWSFFLDKQTDSYSLSKFQFFMFSVVFVFGYLYVFLCRWLVQWQFVLPDVPGNFTAILAMSAGTTLVAAGATAARGSKGSGPMKPSFADFITTGGQVVPERFQFFVWTLMACGGFLALLISQDPATIEKFPSFPDGLLYVMGVSAGGYLGGKVARSAGPVIRNIAWDKVASKIIIQGENLSKAGDFLIDGKKLDIQPSVKEKLVDAKPQEQPGPDGSFCSELKITIAPAAGIDLSAGDHTFRIMNKDGQFSDARFTADLPVIKDVVDKAVLPAQATTIAKGLSEKTVTVKGSGLREGTIVKWKRADATEPIELAASAVKYTSDESLDITLVPGESGAGTLTLVTPNGFSATTTVTVK